MKFVDALAQESSKTLTENGALTYSESGSKCLDFFALGAAKRKRPEEAVNLFNQAYSFNKEMALKILFYVRDIRGGQGEREIFRQCITSLYSRDEEIYNKILKWIPTYGRWDDLVWAPLTEESIRIIGEQLLKDIECQRPSLLAKWLPSENTSSEDTKARATQIREALKMSPRQYRKTLSSLRNKIGILETQMSFKEWGKIDYSKLPGRALLTHKKAFLRNDSSRYLKFLEGLKKGETTANVSTIYPYEILERALQDPTADALWTQLPNYATQKGLVVADVSGSMIGDPLFVAVSLAIYFAERCEGVFHNKFMTFSSRPQLVEIPEGTLRDKYYSMSREDWGMSTNLGAIFDKILDAAKSCDAPQEELPETLYIISDMEFDSCVRVDKTLYQYAKESFENAGYKLPNVVFWNVNSRGNNLPVRKNEIGTTLISGLSPVSFSVAVDGKTPEQVMLDVINSERYSQIQL